MKNISVGKLFKQFIDAINKCGEFLLGSSDEIIGYNIFEVFDIGVITFMHHNSLEKFQNEGMIDDNISEKTSLLRAKVMALQGSALWNVESFKSSQEWLEIMRLSDEINILIKRRWSDTELSSLFKQ